MTNDSNRQSTGWESPMERYKKECDHDPQEVPGPSRLSLADLRRFRPSRGLPLVG